MTIEIIITCIVAAVGWIWAIIQFIVNRRWKKRDILSDRRYEAYSNFMRKLDDINTSLRNNPNLIFGDVSKLLKIVSGNSSEEINEALVEYNKSLINMVKMATEPLLVINQEVNNLLLISSDELREKLTAMKSIVDDYNNEIQNCLSMVSAKDSSSFTQLSTVGHDIRWEDYQRLYEEIVQLMRKELNIK